MDISKDDVGRASDALATKSAIEEADARKQGQASSSMSGTSMSGSVMDSEGVLPIVSRIKGGGFAAGMIGSSRMRMVYDRDVKGGNVIEVSDGDKSVYGKVVDNPPKERRKKGKIEVEDMSEKEFKSYKKENPKVKVIKLSKKNAVEINNGLLIKLTEWLFATDDTVEGYIVVLVKFVVIIAVVVGLVVLVGQFL